MIDLDAQPPPEPLTEESRAPMSRASQISDRDRIEAYFRQEFRAAGVAPDAADRLAARAARRIKRMVVWDDAAAEAFEAIPEATAPATGAPPVVAAGPTAAARPVTGAPAAAEKAPDEPAAAPGSAPESAAADPAFDPYAFSVVVVLTKSGKDGLMKRLAAIDRPEHLRRLADAQHLAVDRALTRAADLRSAIVKAAEARIANRRAAAS